MMDETDENYFDEGAVFAEENKQNKEPFTLLNSLI